MLKIEDLSPMKKKFFESIGICSTADIPNSFNEKILSLNTAISESEKFCIGDYNVCLQSQSLFSMKDLVGTDHDRYAGKTWLEAFLDLDRGDKNLELYFLNPNYYSELLANGYSDLGLVKKDGKYYIYGPAGGGNNRLIIMKLKYLAAISKKDADLSEIDKNFTFLGNIRYVPTKTTADNIFYLTFPDGGFKPSGYYVINRSSSEKFELYDIVTGYPRNIEVIRSSVDGESIGGIDLLQLQGKSK